jgi:hypothetical protein
MTFMKVFISSVEAGYQHYRAVAQEAVQTLGHQVLRAEEWPTSAQTPQQACLAAVRDSDLVVLLIGSQYGAVQQTGLSATHEEYREARGLKPVLVFVESDVDHESKQQTFLSEVEAWATGHFRRSFSTPELLRDLVLRALHDHELAMSAGPVDEESLLERARALIPRRTGSSGSPQLLLAIAGGPYQQVLRPVELEDAELAVDLHREASFGEHPVLDRLESTRPTVRNGALAVEQRTGSILINEVGEIRIVQPARNEGSGRMVEIPALIEEDVVASLARGLRFAGWLLDRVDAPRRLTDVVAVVSLLDVGYMAWRTRAEHTASPGSGSMGSGGGDVTVVLNPPRRHRQALTHDADRMAEDFAALLRRDIRR